MKRIILTKLLPLASLALLTSLAVCPAADAVQTDDDALSKKYEKIMGKYEFEINGENLVVEILIRQGGLWADSGDGRPAEIKPVNSRNEEFTGEDSENGPFQLTFIKDDTGQYTKCHFVMKSQNVDATGKRMK